MWNNLQITLLGTVPPIVTGMCDVKKYKEQDAKVLETLKKKSTLVIYELWPVH